MAPVSFATFRLILVGLAVLAQLYIFLRLSAAIRGGRWPQRGKRALVLLSGAAIGLLFAGNLYVMRTPIPWVDPPAAAGVLLFYAPAVWAFGSILCALLLAGQQALAALAAAAARRLRRGRAPDAAPDELRRRLLRIGIGGLAAGPFVLSSYGAAHAGRDPEVEELALDFGCRLRAVHLTDIHAGIYITREVLRRLAARVAALEPDLLVLTGDYITNATIFFPGFAEEMGRIRPPLGTYATLGNHEHWYGEVDYYRTVLERHGIVLLQNANRVLRTRGGGRFALAGIDDLAWGRPDLDAALDGLSPGLPVMLLSHRPEVFPAAARRGVRLTLAGHYHGGQVALALFGRRLSLADLRTPYPEGRFRIGSAHLYVGRGIGTTFTPVRLNAPPEITRLELA